MTPANDLSQLDHIPLVNLSSPKLFLRRVVISRMRLWVAGLTLLMSSAYLALWLYVGSVVVNLAGAALLAVLFGALRLRRAS